MPNELQWTPDKVRKFWTAIGESPLDELAFSRVAGRALLDRVKPYLPKDAKTVVDLGAGAGHFAKHLSDDGYDVKLFEPAKEIVSPEVLARDNVAWIDPEAPEEPVDVLFCLETIEHILEEELGEFLQRIDRLVKPGGSVVISTPHNEIMHLANAYCVETDTFFHPWQHVRSFTRESLIEYLEPHGIICDVIGTEDFSGTRAIYEELYQLRTQSKDFLNTLLSLRNTGPDDTLPQGLLEYLESLWEGSKGAIAENIHNAVQPISNSLSELIRQIDMDVTADDSSSTHVIEAAEEIKRHTQELIRTASLTKSGEYAQIGVMMSAAQVISDAALQSISRMTIARAAAIETPVSEVLSNISDKLKDLEKSLDTIKGPISLLADGVEQSSNTAQLPQKPLGEMNELELRSVLSSIYSELSSRNRDNFSQHKTDFDFEYGAGSTLIFIGHKES